MSNPDSASPPTAAPDAPVAETALPSSTVTEAKPDETTNMAATTATTDSTATAKPDDPTGAAGGAEAANVAEIKRTETPMTEEPEPQNALTQKFTDAEWKAVKELRKHLPDILKGAYPDNAEATSTPIKLWGVTIDPSAPSDARVSVILVKFLRARHLNVAEAQTMLIGTLRWRQEFKVEECINEEFPQDVFGNLGRVYGHDKGGRPVTYNLYGGNQDLKAIFSDTQRFIRWRVSLMEKGVALLDFENVDQMIQVHDYEGVSLLSRDADSKRGASEATNIFQSHYPEILYKKYFVNIPKLMTWVFWVFKSLVAAQTLAKMHMIGSGPHAIGKELLPLIDAKELPKRYGGEADAF